MSDRPANVCEHGRLRRSCLTCELESEIRVYRAALKQCRCALASLVEPEPGESVAIVWAQARSAASAVRHALTMRCDEGGAA